MRFIVIGDCKGKVHGINEEVLTRILSRTSRLKPGPEFIVMLGDSVAGSIDEQVFIAQLKRLRKLIELYHPRIPVIPVAGNHEAYSAFMDNRYEKILSDIYNDFTPDSMPLNYNKTVYYKDFEDTRLIVLNAFHDGVRHRIEKEQRAWLEDAASANKRNKLLFVHSPAFPTGAHLGHCLDMYPNDRDALWDIIDRCSMDIVFSGHEHNYSRRVVDSSFSNEKYSFKHRICQVITGGGGEKLNDKYKSREGVIVPPIAKYHFVLVDIMEDGIKVSSISSEGKKMDEFKIKK